MCTCVPDRIEIKKCCFLRRGENRSTQRKKLSERGENQQQTQPTYDAGSENRTQATLVGGDHSHHCATPAPQSLKIYGTVALKTSHPPMLQY